MQRGVTVGAVGRLEWVTRLRLFGPLVCWRCGQPAQRVGQASLGLPFGPTVLVACPECCAAGAEQPANPAR
jgi:hypothetical protein